MTKELLNGNLAPITSEIGFLDCPLPVAAKYMASWLGKIQADRGGGIEVRYIPKSGLEAATQALLPLTSVERRRMMLLSTQSNWLSYFDNGWRGADAYSAISHMAEAIGCRGVRANHVPHELDQDTSAGRGRSGSVIFELYGPHETAFINTIRSVAVTHDGKKWVFVESGEIQDFEQTEKYLQRSVRSRFTAEMLSDYLKALGIDAFSSHFYGEDGGIVFEKTGAASPNMKEYSLAEARARF